MNSGLLFSEIIYTYQLLFGQHGDSRKAFRADYRTQIGQKQLPGGHDPLLARVCGRKWNAEPLYDDLGATNPKSIYSANIDFPFFGGRLLDLQDCIVEQTANDWKTLWRDRRDMNRFWTLWAVLIIGTASIVLAIMQVILAIIQVGSSFHQPH